MNIFLGARRLAWAVGLFVFGGLILENINHASDRREVSVIYATSNPDEEFVLRNDPCPRGGVITTTEAEIEIDERLTVRVSLCFLPSEFGEEKELLVPYKVEKNNNWVSPTGPYSDDLLAEYIGKRVNEFSIPDEDLSFLKKAGFKNMVSVLLGESKTLFWMVLIYVGVVWTVGWIVRGFMGIPRGMDKRPD